MQNSSFCTQKLIQLPLQVSYLKVAVSARKAVSQILQNSDVVAALDDSEYVISPAEPVCITFQFMSKLNDNQRQRLLVRGSELSAILPRCGQVIHSSVETTISKYAHLGCRT